MMPTLTRIEYYTPNGWTVGHHGIALLNPERYVERLAAQRKFGRAIELGEDLQPTGKIWEPAELPDVADLIWPTDGTRVPHLRNPPSLCEFCETVHAEPHDGGCLI